MINGPKSIEHKNVLIFLEEIIRNEPQNKMNPEIISEIIPLVVQKFVVAKGFIKNLAGKILNMMITHCNVEGLLYSLILNSGHKNHIIAETCLTYFCKVLLRPNSQTSSVKISLASLSKDLYFIIFKGLMVNLFVKQIKIVHAAESALLVLLEILEQQKFVFIIELMITEACVPENFKNQVSKGITNAQKRKKLNEKVDSKTSVVLKKSALNRISLNKPRLTFPANQLPGLGQNNAFNSGINQMESGIKRTFSNASTTYNISRNDSGSSLKLNPKKVQPKRKSGLGDFIKNQRMMMKGQNNQIYM